MALVRLSQESDIEDLEGRMRAADLVELKAHGIQARVALRVGDEIKDINRQFLRESRTWLERIGSQYELLTNVVHEDNHLHHKWLRFLGFTFIRREKPFIEFARIP